MCTHMGGKMRLIRRDYSIVPLVLFLFHVQHGFHATKLPNQSMVERKVCMYVVHSVISQTSFFVHISFFILMLHILFIIYSMRFKRDFVLHRLGQLHFTFEIFSRIRKFLGVLFELETFFDMNQSTACETHHFEWNRNFKWSNISNNFYSFFECS